MPLPQNLIGVDMAADSFTLTAYDSSTTLYAKDRTFDNQPEGLEKLSAYMDEHQMTPSNTVFCLVRQQHFFLAIKSQN